MIKVRMLKTDEVIVVSKNVAFDLIDRGLAEKFTGNKKVQPVQTTQTPPQTYGTRQLRPEETK